MPQRDDIKTILVIGSGPIVIGQACEFDYSRAGVQGAQGDGYRVVLVNSNPATIMTDPELADRTYVEPITASFVERVIERERPDALLPTLGGQTGLNTAVELAKSGVLSKYGVEMIGLRPGSHRARRGPQALQRLHGRAGHRDGALGATPTPWPTRRPSWTRSATPWCCAPRSRWAARAAASRTTTTSWPSS